MLRIYGDFNHCDDQGRIILDTVGSLEDLRRYEGKLTEGLTVLVYMEDVEVPATLILAEDGVWLAVQD